MGASRDIIRKEDAGWGEFYSTLCPENISPRTCTRGGRNNINQFSYSVSFPHSLSSFIKETSLVIATNTQNEGDLVWDCICETGSVHNCLVRMRLATISSRHTSGAIMMPVKTASHHVHLRENLPKEIVLVEVLHMCIFS
jgi:hypothetical protein